MIWFIMKRAIIVALVIFISFSIAGCSNPPSPPGSEIPMVVVDYVDSNKYSNINENHSIIYVHGLDEIRYKNISIKINNKTVLSKTHTYSSEVTTNLTKFELNIKVVHYEKSFIYNATFEMSEKKDVMYKITYPDQNTNEVDIDDLPYSEKLDQVEER